MDRATPYITFLVAVTITGWCGGLGPSLVATGFAILVEDYFFIAPTHSLEITIENLVRICVFVVVALLISWIDLARKRAIAERDRLIVLEQQARYAAETASRTKDEFLAMVSHELRTPLNVILGWVSMLRSGKLNEEARAAAIDRIERNAELQQRLVADLIDVSRIAAGKLRIDPRLVNLQQVIQDGLNVAALAASTRHIELRVLENQEIVEVVGDPDRLQQVISNLLSNAIKFTAEGGYIELGLARVGQFAQLTVRDSGHGIEPDLLPDIFEPFRQAEPETNQGRGIGLGLSIVRRIVELHGGSIHAQSSGKELGATFTVKLPIASQEALAGIGLAQGVEFPEITSLVVSTRAPLTRACKE
jgi:signal transduction histidine kinase